MIKTGEVVLITAAAGGTGLSTRHLSLAAAARQWPSPEGLLKLTHSVLFPFPLKQPNKLLSKKGHIGVQWAKRKGCKVIGLCSTDAKAAFLRSIGCDRVINYREECLDDILTAEYPVMTNTEGQTRMTGPH